MITIFGSLKMTEQQIMGLVVVIVSVVLIATMIPIWMSLRANMKEMRRLIEEIHSEENEDA